MASIPSRLSCLLASAFILGTLPGAAYADKAKDTLVYASDSEPENISPYHNNLREGIIVARHVFDNLIFRNPDTGKYEPQLATDWTWVDPQTLDLTIRKGVTFHNGDPLTADDVVFTLNMVVSPDSKVVTKQNVNWIKSAEKIGDDKVRIHLVGPFPAAIEYLAGPVVIYPEAYFKKVGLDGFAKAPIGSGPYKVTSVMPGKGVKMEKNTAYWKDSPLGQPKIGKLEFRVIPDPETQVGRADDRRPRLDLARAGGPGQAARRRSQHHGARRRDHAGGLPPAGFPGPGAGRRAPQGPPRAPGHRLCHRPQGHGGQSGARWRPPS